MKLLREYIRTLLEAGELGQYVWPSADPKLRSVDNPNGPSEEDTSVEKQIYQALHKHFTTSSYIVKKNNPPIDPTSAEAIKRILASGEYSDAFQKCASGRAVRGMSVTLPWLKRNAPEAWEAMPDQKPEEWKSSYVWGKPTPVSFTYTPKGKYGEVSSWTKSQETAKVFASPINRNDNAKIECILWAECGSGLFLDTRLLDRFVGGVYADEMDIQRLNNLGGDEGEKELILFGQCQVTHVQLYGTKDRLRRTIGMDV